MKLNKIFYAPKYWPTWLGIFIFYCFCQLPYSWCMAISSYLGYKMFTGTRKEKVMHRNLELCFPEKSYDERQKIAMSSMKSYGQMLYETGRVWWCSDEKFQSKINILNDHYVSDAYKNGKKIILLCQHLHALETAGRSLSYVHRFSIMQGPIKNKLLEAFRLNKTLRFNDSFPTSARAMMQKLKKGDDIIYFSDLNIKKNGAIFAPFFGCSSASSGLLPKLALKDNIVIIPFNFYRQGKKTILEFMPDIVPDFTGELVHDTAIVNSAMERNIRQNPEQYMWHLKRFKTRPEGESDLYEGI